MPDLIGTIVVTRHTNINGIPERLDYEWRGGPQVMVSRDLAEDLDTKSGLFVFGPYRLRIIQDEYFQPYYLCVREDYPFWRIVLFWHKFGRILDIAYRRLIITMVVWRLADRNEGVIPSWRDIRIVKRFWRHPDA